MAIDRNSGMTVGFHVANRTRKDAKKLWKSLPGVYRQCAVCYSGFREAYGKVIPESRHRAAGKETGRTDHIERFNCTLRQRVSRPVRKALSFSKNEDSHIRSIRYFIWKFNSALLVWHYQNANAGDVYLVKNPVSGKDQATFAGENYPDNTSVTGGSTFTKEWRIRNTGSTTWTSAYKLRIYRVSRGRISTVTQTAVSGTIGKNSVYNFRVPMKAPSAQTGTKTYREDWTLVGPSGIIPVSGSKTVWVQIRVPGVSAPPQPTGGSVYGVLHENSASGPLLAGATVTIAGKNAVTSGNGYYSLSGLSTHSKWIMQRNANNQ